MGATGARLDHRAQARKGRYPERSEAGTIDARPAPM